MCAWTTVLVVLISLAWGSSAITVDDCPQHLPRDEYLTVFGDSCYEFRVHELQDYPKANRYCQREGGNLVSITSQKKQDFVFGQLKNVYEYMNGYVWIGLNDIDKEGTFVWEDGSPLDYENFKKGLRPKAGGVMQDFQDCVTLMMPDGSWYVFNCHDEGFNLVDQKRPYICEYPYIKAMTTEIPETPTATLTPSSSGIPVKSCPDNLPSNEYLKMYGDSCYQFRVNERKDYKQSEYFCERQGGHLVSITSKEEQDFIHGQLENVYGYKTGYVWIGLNDIGEEGKFIWEDGSPFDYENFKKGLRPKAGGIMQDFQDCVTLTMPGGGWYVFNCDNKGFNLIDQKRPYICEYPVIKKTITTTTTTTTTTITPNTTTTSKNTTTVTTHSATTTATATAADRKDISPTPQTTCPPCQMEICGAQGYTMHFVDGCYVCSCINELHIDW